MMAFEFMKNAFFICAGVACLWLAILIVWGTALGIYKSIKRSRKKR